MRLGIATVAVLTLGADAFAAPSAQFVLVAQEAGFTPPAGFVTQDLVVDTDVDWLAANLIVALSAGSIYQDAIIAGIGPPSSALVSVLPSTRWDTYVMGSGGLDAGAPSSAGGAVDLGGNPTATFNTSHIDLNWFTTSTNDVGVFSLGRFTFSNDAVGEFVLRLDFLNSSATTRDAAGPFTTLTLRGEVVGGELVVIPEAGALALAGAGGLVALAGLWRRRKRAVVAAAA
jgi:hypothetical protein